MNVKKLDRYMSRIEIDCSNLEFFNPRNGDFVEEGLYWFNSEKRYQTALNKLKKIKDKRKHYSLI
jgi:hypothetical protein